jgi:H+/Cl- antiporter ClcA
LANKILDDLKRQQQQFLSFNVWRLRLVFWTGAVLVGAVTLMFSRLAELADHLFSNWAQQNPLLPFVLTPAGLIAVAWMTRRFLPGAEGSGVPQVIATLESNAEKRFLGLRIVFGKIACTLLALISGASVGIMGPSVQIGSSIMLGVHRFASFPAEFYHRGMIIAGGAAGFAAAFNTPLAGIVFAFEQLSRSLEQKTSGLILTTVILSGLTAMALQGSQPYFSVSAGTFSFDPNLFIALGICGVVGGVLGGLFSRLIVIGSRSLKPLLQANPIRVIAVLGLIIALTGYLSGHASVGTGHQEVNAIVSGTQVYDPWFPLYKFIATLASYFTGIPGGIFAPALATGAGIGQNLAHLMPLAPMAFMILTGMVAYFSGVIQAPITAMVIVLEMTSNQSMIFPLMIAAVTGSAVSSAVCPRSLFSVLASSLNTQQKTSTPEQRAD